MFPSLHSPEAELLTPVLAPAAFTRTRCLWLVEEEVEEVEEVEEGRWWWWWWWWFAVRASISAVRRFVLM